MERINEGEIFTATFEKTRFEDLNYYLQNKNSTRLPAIIIF